MDNPPFTTCCFLSLVLFDSVRLLRSKVPRLTRTLPQRAQTTRSGTDSAAQDQITQCCINRRGVFIHLLALAAALHPFGSFALPPFHLFLRCCSVIVPNLLSNLSPFAPPLPIFSPPFAQARHRHARQAGRLFHPHNFARLCITRNHASSSPSPELH